MLGIHREPVFVELTDDGNDLHVNADILSVSDDGSLDDVEVEERDMMLPSLDVSVSDADPISLPPMKIKLQKSWTRRVSMDNHQRSPMHQAPIRRSAASPSFCAGHCPQLVLTNQADCRSQQEANKVYTPLTTTASHGLECHQFDPSPSNQRDGRWDDASGQAWAEEFFSALRQFADTMKRSEYSRREVILGRRRLRHLYQELAGLDHLLSGESWGRSVDYQLARRELVAEVYGQLLRRFRSHPAASEDEACYTYK